MLLQKPKNRIVKNNNKKSEIDEQFVFNGLYQYKGC